MPDNLAQNLNDYFAQRFSANNYFLRDQLAFWEENVHAATFDRATAEDPLVMTMRGMDPNQRRSFKSELYNTIDFDSLEGVEGVSFKTVKPPRGRAGGYGYYSVSSGFFRESNDRDAIAMALNIMNPNFQIDSSGNIEISGRMSTQKMIDRTADVIADPSLMQGKLRLVFDVETAGLDKQDKIWQVAASLVDDQGNVVETMNQYVRNPLMDMGAYQVNGQAVPFETYFKSLPGNENAQFVDDTSRVVSQFLGMADRADVLVGQNVGFDIGMQAEMFKQWAGNDKQKLAKVQGFMNMVENGDVVDTRLLIQAFMGDMVKPAKGESVASIRTALTRSNMLEVIEQYMASDGIADPSAYMDEVLARGTHNAAVDVRLTSYIERVLLDRADPNKSVPQLRGLAGREADTLLRSARGKKLMSSAPVPIATKMAYQMPDGSMRTMTPAEYYNTVVTRDLGRIAANETTLSIGSVMSRSTLNGGLYSKWMNSVMEGGRVTGNLAASGYEEVQKRAIRAGLPFAEIGAHERILSSLMGRTLGFPGNERTASAFGSLLGVGKFNQSQNLVFKKGNIAMKMDTLRAMERNGLIDITNFDAVSKKQSSDVLLGRLSIIEGLGKEGEAGVGVMSDFLKSEKDVGKLATAFENIAQMEAEAAKAFGVAPETAADMARALRADPKNVLKYGVQLGVLFPEEKGVDDVVTFLRQLGFSSDVKADMKNFMFGLWSSPAEEGGGVYTSPAVQQSQLDDLTSDLSGSSYLGKQVGRSRELMEKMLPEASINRVLYRMVENSSLSAARQQKAVDLVTKAMQPKNIKIGIGGLAALGGAAFYFSRRDEDNQLDETMIASDEYETDQDYQAYKEDLGEYLPIDYRESPLSTAGLVQDLHDNKTNHHRMGNARYAHLF